LRRSSRDRKAGLRLVRGRLCRRAVQSAWAVELSMRKPSHQIVRASYLQRESVSRAGVDLHPLDRGAALWTWLCLPVETSMALETTSSVHIGQSVSKGYCLGVDILPGLDHRSWSRTIIVDALLLPTGLLSVTRCRGVFVAADTTITCTLPR